MKDNAKNAVRELLIHYLDQNAMRKTPERFAILDAVLSFGKLFSIDELADQLEETNFYVSRATLYNTLKLLQEIRLLACHRIVDGTRYEVIYDKNSHIHQICTICGKDTEVKSAAVNKSIEEARLKRFRRESFVVFIYGICSTCQARITREKNRKRKN